MLYRPVWKYLAISYHLSLGLSRAVYTRCGLYFDVLYANIYNLHTKTNTFASFHTGDIVLKYCIALKY